MNDKLEEISFLEDISKQLIIITRRIDELNSVVHVRSKRALQEINDFETRHKLTELINTKTENEAKEKGYERESYLK